MVAETADVMALWSPKPAGHVTCAPVSASLVPGVRPGTTADGLVGLRFAFSLSPPNDQVGYVAAFLRARFDDSRVTASEVGVEDTGAAGTSVSVPRPGMVGWLVGSPTGTDPIPEHVVAHATVRVPAGTTVLSGTLHVDVSFTLSSLAGVRRRHASSRTGSVFSVAPPPGFVAARPPVDTPVSAVSAADEAQQPAVRLCYAVDIERFSRFTAPEVLRAQRRLVELLAAARAHAGLDETTVIAQEAGDGQFVVLPPGLDESVVLPRLVEGVRLWCRETNADLNERARLRLRFAFHRGHVHPAANGWAGDASIAVHRLLDSGVLRTALANAPGADVAFIVPDVLYRDIVAHRYGTLDPDEFTRVKVTVPAKRFSEPAWLHVPR